MPARHSHPEIDGLPSVFLPTENVREFAQTPEFQDFLDSQNSNSITLYVTWLTQALLAFQNMIKVVSQKSYISNKDIAEYWGDINVLPENVDWFSTHVEYRLYDRDTDSYRTL